MPEPIWEREPKYCLECEERIIPDYYVAPSRWRSDRVKFCSRPCLCRYHDCGWNKGRRMPESTKERLRQTIAENGGRSGRRNPMFGRKRPDTAARARKMWQDPAFRAKMVARMKSGGGAKARRACGGRSSLERTMAEWLDDLGIQYEAQALIDGHCVDFFVRRDGKADVVIECDGDYWHSLPVQALRDSEQTSKYLSMGLEVVRFSGTEIRKEEDHCRRTLKTV